MELVNYLDKFLIDPVTKIQYGFNYGAEIKTPADVEGTWSISFFNDDSGDLLYHVELAPGAYFATPIKYYIRWKVVAINLKSHNVFSTILDCKDRYVLFRLAHKTLGACIAYMSQVQAFVKKHECKPIIYAQKWFIELFARNYPDYTMVDDEGLLSEIPLYATYFLGIVFDPAQYREWNKVSYQTCGLQHIGANILGLPTDIEPEPPLVTATDEGWRKKPTRPYVCIGYSGSKACKLWWNPVGWRGVIEHLNYLGLDVVCIDRDAIIGMPGSFYQYPKQAINWTGDYTLQFRVNQIMGAEFFIGVASGLSWLAWCCRKPIVLISGFSRPSMEFKTPYRVYNEENLCNDCWGDTSIPFWHHAWGWCPRVDKVIHELTDQIEASPTIEEKQMVLMKRDEEEAKKFSCTLNITAERVNRTIDRLIEQEKINVQRKPLA